MEEISIRNSCGIKNLNDFFKKCLTNFLGEVYISRGFGLIIVKCW